MSRRAATCCGRRPRPGRAGREERAVARRERIAVAVDLRDKWLDAPAAAGHDPAAPTVGNAEGLLIHRPEDAVELPRARVGGVPVSGGDARRPGGPAGRARL
ncbi:class I SAM-dependent methyltransferase [Streptomyces griseoviridis]|uniref:class I SAM-dependent methyltransferase n=1 Tax=Streptomyces griseoviridis TaxID=45398 RepID=UPI003F54E3BD